MGVKLSEGVMEGESLWCTSTAEARLPAGSGALS
jgi:hypothetical protein